MNLPGAIDPVVANQQRMSRALEWLRRRLESVLQAESGAAQVEDPGDLPIPGDDPFWTLGMVADRFGLSPFERDVLLLAAAPELDSNVEDLVSRLHRDPRQRKPTFGMAMSALPSAHWSAMGPDAPLRRWRLLEVHAADSLTRSPLRADERILHFLCGVAASDDRLKPLFRPLALDYSLPACHRRVAALCVRHLSSTPHPIAMNLVGGSPQAARAIAVAIAQELETKAFIVDALDLPESPADREGLARLWEREVLLSGALAVVEMHGHDGEHRRLSGWLDQLRGSVVVLSRDVALPTRPHRFHIDLPTPPPAEMVDLWQASLSRIAPALHADLSGLSQEFRLTPDDVHWVGTQLESELATSPDNPSAGDTVPALPAPPHEGWIGRLRALCRTRARAPLEALAQRMEPASEWDDLVLPPEAKNRLREIVLHARHRHRVSEEWGFASRGSRGLGLAALFAGPSGTGKTMAAEVLAHELNLELFRIDLSAVVSKYIGETEKNLRRVFDAADSGVAILLFDEADALFGKRSEVKDSHDRYANIEVSYLLQRMEAYRGIAILTTNLKASLDSAFVRRLRFIVQFPFPDAKQRAEIWRRVFPTQTPTEGLLPSRLAQLNLAGGHIRNIAFGAAILAAEAGEPVRMSHLDAAARAEYAKLERPTSEAEFAGWHTP